MKIYKQNELISEGYEIENNQIKSVDIEIIRHYENIPSLQVDCHNLKMFKIYNNTESLGYLLKFFIEFFDLLEEDGIKLSKIKNIPCRLIFNKDGECVGFGHFMENKFVLTKDFMNILNEEELK